MNRNAKSRLNSCATNHGNGNGTANTNANARARFRVPRFWGGAACVLLILALPLLACGPRWFPSRLLGDGGRGVLWAPIASFALEIGVMKLATTRLQAVPSTNSHPAEAADADLADLRVALTAEGGPGASIERIINAHAAEREALRAAAEASLSNANAAAPTTVNPGPGPALALLPAPARVVDGLPAEFADYFRGAIAWHRGATNAAIDAWERLLKLPEARRRHRSVWAAFMLGKATWETDPSRAVRHFQQTRTLARSGFADRLGLAASSLGWEGRTELRRGRFERAIDLYLEQVETGDNGALRSLHFAAELALRQNARNLEPLARHPRAQRVVTAYIISGGWNDPLVDIDNPLRESVIRLLEKQTWVGPPTNGWHKLESPARLWLGAIEAAGVRDVESAEKIAVAAYQSGEFETARRWLERAREQPAAQWLKAKLALRDGKLDEAAGILSGLARRFPPGQSGRDIDPTANPGPAPAVLFERLQMDQGFNEGRDAPSQALGEWGALRLARREYTEALDALLRAGYFDDAVYVADRVLTVDELKAYVDRAWPAGRSAADDSTAAEPDEPGFTPRAWLASRLVRARRLEEARRYLKAEYRPVLDAYTAGLDAGRDPRLPDSVRAAALWDAAGAVMASALNVFNAPVETVWGISGGFFMTNTPPERLQPGGPPVLPVSQDEENRVRLTDAFPNRDWYYRFIATELAWEAARLMPDNSTETAHVLWQAGTWIKYIDPAAADRFYKALVRRCGKTSLGQTADRKRWFPAGHDAQTSEKEHGTSGSAVLRIH